MIGAAARFRPSTRRPARWTSWKFQAYAEEDATYEAGLYRVGGRRVLGADGKIDAYWTPLVQFPAKRLKPGRYVFRIRMRAAMNPERTIGFAGRPFRVLGRRR